MHKTKGQSRRQFLQDRPYREQSHGWALSARLCVGGEEVLELNQRACRGGIRVDPAGPVSGGAVTLSRPQSDVQHVVQPGSFCSREESCSPFFTPCPEVMMDFIRSCRQFLGKNPL